LNLNLQTPLGYETIRPVIVKSLRRIAQMATIAAEYKATRWLFRRRHRREKAMANRTKRAHGEGMHNHRDGADLFMKDGT
jgi:hypothetical protein